MFAWQFSITQMYIIALQLRGTINANFNVIHKFAPSQKIVDAD